MGLLGHLVHPLRLRERSRSHRSISGQWINSESREQLQSLGIKSEGLVQAFAYGPRSNAVLVLNLKTGASTALKRLEIAEARVTGDEQLILSVQQKTASDLWVTANRLTHPLMFCGSEWRLASSAASWTSTCRNPYTRFVSGFAHLSRVGVISARFTVDSFAEWCLKGRNRLTNRHWLPQTCVLTADVLGRLDYLIPIEGIEQSSVGPKWFQIPASAREHSNPDTVARVTGLSLVTLERIRKLYQADFDALGYTDDPANCTARPSAVISAH